MARLGKKNKLSGLIGNLVFRDLNGNQIVQSRPNKIKQTKATKVSSSEFRQCSSWAKQLRNNISEFLLDKTDSQMHSRFLGLFYNTLQKNTTLPKGQRTPFNSNMSNLSGFEFNLNTVFNEYFLSEIEVTLDQQITITIPEFEPSTQVVFPKETSQATLLLYVCATALDSNIPIEEANFTVDINQNQPLQSGINWTSQTISPGYLVIVTAKLLYFNFNKFTGKNYLNSKELNPATLLFCDKA